MSKTLVSDVNVIIISSLYREMACFNVKRKEKMVTRRVEKCYPAVVCDFNENPLCM